MNSIDALIKSTEFAQKLNKQLGMSKSMMKFIESQELWQNKLSPMTMTGSIFKAVAQHPNRF